MSETTECICQKQKEIADLEAKVKILNTIVMGNGRPGLAQLVPELTGTVKELNHTVANLTTGVSGLLQFQEQELGRQQGKLEMRKRNRWIIGIMITLATSLLGGLIYLMNMVLEHLASL